jgi:hypothetical protein
MYKLLWMQLDSVMKGIFKECIIYREIELSGSFNIMRKKKKDTTDGRKKESLLGDTKGWGKLQTTLLDRRMKILNFRNPLLSSHHLRVLLFNP